MSNKLYQQDLTTLLADLVDEQHLSQIAQVKVSGLTLDSRHVKSGSVFVALNGSNTDGRLYIEQAINQGAVAILCEVAQGNSYIDNDGAVPIIYLANLEQRLSQIASVFYNHPQLHMQMIAITGTNGKTTVTQLISQWLTLLGHKTYSMGTLGNGLAGQLVASPNTTLNAIDLIAHLALAKESGAQTVVMEVSSHGLELGRVKAITFDVAAFTNLSQDHLDFHGDMASYARAKRQLFSAKYTKQSVLNGNDATALGWAQTWDYSNPLSSFNQKLPHASQYLLASDVRYSAQGISAKIDASFGLGQLNSKLLGQFNLDNLLTALNVLCLCGEDLSQLLDLAPQLNAVPGRMDVFQAGNSPTVVVDYAHTPDALKQALLALRRHCNGTLSVVFGCGGDRDNSKRSLMAKIAQLHADKVMITQDNSRSEPFSKILAHMLQGIDDQGAINIQGDRRIAVAQAVKESVCGDMVLLAGKGHEDYQIIDGKRLAYDERALAKSLVEGYL